jgi:dienelactone hydrolase
MKVEDIRYAIGGANFQGQLVYDDTVTARRPALLMAPTWMGVNADSAERAKLVGSGRYVVFVADMYGEGKRPRNVSEAAALANPLRGNPPESRRRIGEALRKFIEEGERRGLIDSGRRAAVGFCFGGGNVLELARSGAGVQAVVSVHGDLTSSMPAGYGDIRCAVLALHGSDDPIAPKSQRDAFETEMQRAKAKWELVVFGGLLHSFTDPRADVADIAKYDESATRQTYERMHSFIAEAFGKRR